MLGRAAALGCHTNNLPDASRLAGTSACSTSAPVRAQSLAGRRNQAKASAPTSSSVPNAVLVHQPAPLRRAGRRGCHLKCAAQVWRPVSAHNPLSLISGETLAATRNLLTQCIIILRDVDIRRRTCATADIACTFLPHHRLRRRPLLRQRRRLSTRLRPARAASMSW